MSAIIGKVSLLSETQVSSVEKFVADVTAALVKTGLKAQLVKYEFRENRGSSGRIRLDTDGVTPILVQDDGNNRQVSVWFPKYSTNPVFGATLYPEGVLREKIVAYLQKQNCSGRSAAEVKMEFAPGGIWDVKCVVTQDWNNRGAVRCNYRIQRADDPSGIVEVKVREINVLPDVVL